MASKERQSVASEPFFDMPCVVCTKSGRHVEATKTCIDCRQTLCSKCLKEHDKFDITKGHRVLDKATPIAGQVDLPSQICSDHGGKLIDMYCSQHDSVCCTSCIAIHHRRCDHIGYVPTISSGTRTSPRLQTTLRDLKDMLSKLKERKRERENDQKRLADEKESSEKNVQESARKIIAHVNDLKDRSLYQIQCKYNEFQQRADDDIDNISDAITSLEEDIKRLQLPSDNDSELFVTMKQSVEHEKLGSNLNSKTGTNLKKEALIFNADHQIEENMKKLESLGELETPFFSAQSLGLYKIDLNEDKKLCFTSGICSMPDGKNLITDSRNRSLKLLDSSYKLIKHCKLPGQPLSICPTGPTEVAIALAKMIQFVSVTETLTLSGSFRIDEDCRGIAFSCGHLYITCGGCSQWNEGPGEVRVYSTDGKLLHNLPQQTTGPSIWSCPLRIAMSLNGNKMAVADQKTGIVLMKRDGNNRFVSESEIRLTSDNLCVQDRSLWFACGSKAKNIYQVSSNGTYLGDLLTEENGINAEPWSISYQNNGDRLIVGFRACEYIKVFQLHRK